VVCRFLYLLELSGFLMDLDVGILDGSTDADRDIYIYIYIFIYMVIILIIICELNGIDLLSNCLNYLNNLIILYIIINSLIIIITRYSYDIDYILYQFIYVYEITYNLDNIY